MVIDADVVIGPNGDLLPISMNMACRRKRDQGGLVQPLEELLARGSKMAADAGIQPRQFFSDCRVQLFQREERPMAQPRDNPALHQQHSAFCFRFVLGFVRPGRENSRLIVACKIRVAAVDARLMKAGAHDGRFNPDNSQRLC